MKRLALALSLFVGVAALSLAADDADKALKEIQGDYTLKAMVKGGMNAPDEIIKAIEDIKIKDDQLTIKYGGETKLAKIKLDPSKKPAHLDLTPQDGPNKDKPMLGLYKLEKGELSIVIAHSGERPKDFDAKGEVEMKMVMQKKEK